MGPEHPEVADALQALGELYVSLDRHAEAEPLYVQALAIREEALDPNHSSIADVLEGYAALLRATGRDQEAVPLEARAIAIRAASGG